MKTKLAIIFSFLFLFVLSNTAFATSGACSSHGGVNCSLSNSYKSAICNDGNSDSYTSYSDLQECKTATTCDNGQVTAFSASRGLSGSSFGQSASSNCDSVNNSQNNIYIPTIQTSSDSWKDKYCTDTYGSNAFYNSSKNACRCIEGYMMDNTSKVCLPEKEVLTKIYRKHLEEEVLIYMPEYKDIVDVNKIIEMALNRDNKDKTFKQLIVEAYGDKIKIKEEVIPEVSVKEVITPKSTKIDTYQKPLPSKDISPELTPITPSKSPKTAPNSSEVPIVESKPEVEKKSFLGAITGKVVTGLHNLFTSFKNIFSRNK